MAVVTADGSIGVWETASGRPEAARGGVATAALAARYHRPPSIAFSTDGRSVVYPIVASDGRGGVADWDWRRDVVREVVMDLPGPPTSVATGADGRLAAAAGGIVWDGDAGMAGFDACEFVAVDGDGNQTRYRDVHRSIADFALLPGARRAAFVSYYGNGGGIGITVEAMAAAADTRQRVAAGLSLWGVIEVDRGRIAWFGEGWQANGDFEPSPDGSLLLVGTLGGINGNSEPGGYTDAVFDSATGRRVGRLVHAGDALRSKGSQPVVVGILPFEQQRVALAGKKPAMYVSRVIVEGDDDVKALTAGMAKNRTVEVIYTDVEVSPLCISPDGRLLLDAGLRLWRLPE